MTPTQAQSYYYKPPTTSYLSAEEEKYYMVTNAFTYYLPFNSKDEQSHENTKWALGFVFGLEQTNEQRKWSEAHSHQSLSWVYDKLIMVNIDKIHFSESSAKGLYNRMTGEKIADYFPSETRTDPSLDMHYRVSFVVLGSLNPEDESRMVKCEADLGQTCHKEGIAYHQFYLEGA